MEKYTGFRLCDVAPEVVDQIHKDGIIEVWDKRFQFFPNMYLELKDVSNEKHTALGRVTKDGNKIEKIKATKASGISPRNREQVFTLDALMNDDITVVILTGIAGGGKTLLSLAAAMEKIQSGVYKKIVISRPMSEVGKYKLGSLPGGIEEKFGPYLSNYTTNLEQFAGSRRQVTDLFEQSRFEVVPIQLMRGASFNGCLVIVDEVQILPPMEILTIGSRIGENSKVVLMGDLQQRDECIAKEKTGIYKMMNDKLAKESPLVAAVELQVCERSQTAVLFSKIFEENT